MRIRFDMSTDEAERASRVAAEALGRVEPRMLEIAERAAQHERQTHAYQNRTGELQASTVANEIDVDDRFIVELRMGNAEAFYAPFVVARGYSAFPEIAEKAGKAIASMVDRAVKASVKG